MDIIVRGTLSIVMSLIIALSGASCDNTQTTADWVLARTGIYIGELVEVDSWDNHHEVECGGLFRAYPERFDGDSLDVFECSAGEFSQIDGHWRSLPLPESLDRLILSGRPDAENRIPHIEDGYYLYIDRKNKAESPSDDGLYPGRSSINLSLFIYDMNHELLYYYELDI